MIVISPANFSIVPTNVTQAEGLNALFFCRHDAAEGYKWSVNNVPITIIGSPNISAHLIAAIDNGALISRLTITALPEYNESDVECVAFIENGRSNTQPVTLTIQGNTFDIINSVLQCM